MLDDADRMDTTDGSKVAATCSTEPAGAAARLADTAAVLSWVSVALPMALVPDVSRAPNAPPAKPAASANATVAAAIRVVRRRRCGVPACTGGAVSPPAPTESAAGKDGPPHGAPYGRGPPPPAPSPRWDSRGRQGTRTAEPTDPKTAGTAHPTPARTSPHSAVAATSPALRRDRAAPPDRAGATGDRATRRRGRRCTDILAGRDRTRRWQRRPCRWAARERPTGLCGTAVSRVGRLVRGHVLGHLSMITQPPLETLRP